jgi:hypothetical protein
MHRRGDFGESMTERTPGTLKEIDCREPTFIPPR